MKRMMTYVIFLAISVYGQIEFSPKYTSVYDNNVNNNSLNQSSQISSLNLLSGYRSENETSLFRFFYDGYFNYYSSLPDKSDHLHSANLEYVSTFGGDDLNNLSLGADYGLRRGRESYAILDHDVLTAYSNIKLFMTEWLINKYGYTFRYAAFSQLSDLDYSEHSIYAHAAFALSQKTTLIFQTDFGMKFYSNSAGTETGSKGKKSISFIPDVSQISCLLKLGQGLAENHGLSITARYQYNLNKKARYLSSDYGYISDDEVFDDHYGYEGFSSALTLTSLLSESVKMKLTLGFQEKNYSTLPAYDLAGQMISSQRFDKRRFLSLQTDKHFIDYGFSIQAAADIIQNTSNDPLFNYNNLAASVSVVFDF